MKRETFNNNLLMINRELSKNEAEKKLVSRKVKLEEVIDFNTKVISHVKTIIEENDKPVFYLYFHIIENADAICELLKEGCVVPAILQLRSIYESYLHLLYILDSDNQTEIKIKSTFWLINSLEEDKRRIENCDIGKNKDGNKVIDKETILNKINEELIELYKRILVTINKKLKNMKILRKLSEYFDKKINEGKGIVYDIYKNKKDSFLSDYLILYHKWSEYSHAQSRGFFTSSPGEIPKFRDISELDNIYDFTIHILISSSHLIINHKRSNDQALVREYDELSRRWNNEIKYRNGG
jgi:hypothetical protein